MKDDLTIGRFLKKLVALTNADKIKWEDSGPLGFYSAKLKIDGTVFSIAYYNLQDEQPRLSLNSFNIYGYHLWSLRDAIHNYYKRNDLFGWGKTAEREHRKLRKSEQARARQEVKEFAKSAEDILKAFDAE